MSKIDPKVHFEHPHLDRPRPNAYNGRLTRASVLDAMNDAVNEMGADHVYPYDEIRYFEANGKPEHLLGCVLLEHGYNKGMLGDHLNYYASIDQVLALIPGGWNDRPLIEALCLAQDRHDGTIPANRWPWGDILEQFQVDVEQISLRMRRPEPPPPLLIPGRLRRWRWCAAQGCLCWTWTRFLCMRCRQPLCSRHRKQRSAHWHETCPLPAE